MMQSFSSIQTWPRNGCFYELRHFRISHCLLPLFSSYYFQRVLFHRAGRLFFTNICKKTTGKNHRKLLKLFFVLLSHCFAGFVGLSLSYALSLTGIHVFMTQFYCKISNQITSVERIKQFMHIKSEPHAIISENRPPSSWPLKGRIELEDLKV